MVASDDDRRGDLTGPDQFVERGAGPRAFPVTEPADPCRQPLERHPGLGHLDPSSQPFVLGEELENRLVGPQDIGRVAR